MKRSTSLQSLFRFFALLVPASTTLSCEEGCSGESEAPDLPPPIGVIATSEHNVTTVSWDAAAGASGYRVHWDDAPNVTEDDPVVEVEAPTTEFRELIRGREYFFRVSADYPAGQSGLSSEVSAVHTGGTFSSAARPIVEPARTDMQGGLHVDDTGVYIAWNDVPSREFRFAKSADGGSTWHWFTIDEHDTPENEGSLMSALVFRLGERIVVPHTNYHVPRVASSTDGGENWEVADLPANTFPIDLAIDGGVAHVLSFGESANGLAISSSTDGLTWSRRDVPADRPDTACLHVAGERILIAHQRIIENAAHVMAFTSSADGGATWVSSDIDLETDSGYNCSIVPHQDAIFVTYDFYRYVDGQNVNRLMLARSDDDGATWERISLDDTHLYASPASLISREDVLHVVHHREHELVLKTSTDGGSSFAERTLLSHNGEFSVPFSRAKDWAGSGHATFLFERLEYIRFPWEQ